MMFFELIGIAVYSAFCSIVLPLLLIIWVIREPRKSRVIKVKRVRFDEKV